MRFLDSEAKKTSGNILHALNESAASVKKQINTDKPEEAPKETKEALIKKTQSPKIPTKALKENDVENLAVGDIIQVPYKYGAYTPGEYTDAKVIEIDGEYVTVEIPSKLTLTKKQMATFNLGESSIKEDEDLGSLQNRLAELQDYLDNTPDIADDEKAAIQTEIDELIDEINYRESEANIEIEEPTEDDLHLGEAENK